MHRVCVIDDEKAMRFALRRALSKEFEVTEAEDGETGLNVIARDRPALVLLDLNMPGLPGMEVLERLQATTDAPPPVVILTAHGSERIAVEAMKRGAVDYLPKPYDIDELRLVCRRAIEHAEPKEENARLKEALRAGSGDGDLLGQSEGMRAVHEMVARVARLDATVLILGESGTGKEMVARALHKRSPRAAGPFVAVNCAALPEGLMESELFGHERGAFTGAVSGRPGRFELARGGTLFLDEVGEAPASLQAKLLRVLENKRFHRVGGADELEADVRLVAATNRDLKERVRQGSFREDLYYRLRVVDIELPPLRARGPDIALLSRAFIGLAATRHGLEPRPLSARAAAALARYSFPGNVRELLHLLEKATILARGPVLGLGDLPAEVAAEAGPLDDVPDDEAAAGPPPTRAAAADRDDDDDDAGDDDAADGPAGGLGPALAADLASASRVADEVLAQPGLTFADAKKKAIERFEAELLGRALARNRGNVSKTARALGLHRQSLQNKLRELGVDAEPYRS